MKRPKKKACWDTEDPSQDAAWDAHCERHLKEERELEKRLKAMELRKDELDGLLRRVWVITGPKLPGALREEVAKALGLFPKNERTVI